MIRAYADTMSMHTATVDSNGAPWIIHGRPWSDSTLEKEIAAAPNSTPQTRREKTSNYITLNNLSFEKAEEQRAEHLSHGHALVPSFRRIAHSNDMASLSNGEQRSCPHP
jgi:hypothetical protein